MNIAAVAIIVASLTAVGAITGLIPAAHSQKNPEAAQTREAADKPSDALAGRNRPTQLVAVCPQCGVIESIQAVEVKGQGSGVGAVAGAVAVRKLDGIQEAVKFPLPKGLKLEGAAEVNLEHLR